MIIPDNVDLPPFKFPDLWNWVEKSVTPEEWSKISRELKALQEQNADALQNMFLLGFGAGAQFARRAYEKKERS